MASADMCEHDWPGSGCPECRASLSPAATPVSEPWDGQGTAPWDKINKRTGKPLPTPVSEAGGEVKVDIVERLQNDGSSWAQELFNEAAAEIIKLREALAEPASSPARKVTEPSSPKD